MTVTEDINADEQAPSKVSPTFKPVASHSMLWGTRSSIDDIRSSPRRVAVDILRLFISNRVPITLWGPIGARKTRTVEAFAREHDENGVPYQVIDIQPSTEDPTVIHGMMYTSLDDEGKTIMRRSIPDVAQQVVEYYERTGGLTILFLDEMTTCMPAQQHALLGILTHGRYGDLDIRPYITVVMAANPEETVSTVNPLGEQVINRGGHIAWYGDMNLFLEEWRTGFNGAMTPPDEDIDWYITTLLNEAPEKVFRNERWSIDNLVPWDLLEHTERVVTELGPMIATVNERFGDCSDSVRHHYIVEVTKALMGKDWARRMQTVTAKESDRISGEPIIELLKQRNVTRTLTPDELKSTLNSDLFVHPGHGGNYRQDQLQSIAADLMERFKSSYDEWASLGLWSLIATSPDEGTQASLMAYAASLLIVSLEAVKRGDLPREKAGAPAFIDDTLRQRVRALIRSQEELE